ncbi:phosphopantothenoylcysteine decarboxylase [Talaromyces proteolyticus]|uniref:Phosphopantothenoylcysteine decarboxylase n=1 Tax=Talaromyces proteolyticus TaxID=1131652 RepID=A0AAD4KIM6_9EURO|nr:phosphopantothenoylcysteine decarboxylase [Talaromyces proteolyticus]KAH8689390.1 phosphopantothenoylcysteine decarboxylase [Talaromyces proteolyticus]
MTTSASHIARSPATAVSAAINDGKMHLLLAASGSVATIKLPLIISAFKNHQNLSIRVIITKSATNFLAGQSPEQPAVSTLTSLANVDGVYLDKDEWIEPWTRNSSILHIELRRWAHLLAIVPMSANLLAKITGGLCDDLLSCVIRAWDTKRTILAAPAMNQLMWEHPITAKQLAILEDWNWVEILSPQVKALACGDVGQGGMCDWKHIVEVIEQRLAEI